MHWVVASITARVDVYVMMVGSLTDDQIRHSPDYIDGSNLDIQQLVCERKQA